MSTATLPVPNSAPAVQNADPALAYTHEDFERLSAAYPDLRMELTAEGELIIMPPTGGGSSRRNIKITTQLENWSEPTGLGVALESNCNYALPNGSERAPDASWIAMPRWDALGPLQQEKFLPLCPDFAAELLSPSDRLTKTREKMEEYLANGLRLGWLINPRDRTVEVYRPDHDTETLNDPATVSGADVLPGFTLDLKRVWG